MQTEVTKKLFTVEEYYRMAEVGILTPQDRVELIEGEIIEMSPIGDRHAGCVNRATRLFIAALGTRVVVSVQNPLQLSDFTEPEPDVVVLKPRGDDYTSKKVRGEDALLVVEVAETTLSYDRGVKVPLYARAGVPEVWVENLKNNTLLVYRDPDGGNYKTSLVLRSGDTVSPVTLPDLVIQIDELLAIS
jgi:Uma2 family endonuclease